MKIRTKLTLWYAAILFLSVLVIGGAAYKHFLDERRAQRRGAAIGEFFREEMESWDDLAAMALWCGLPAAIIGLGGGWFLMRKALAPVTQLTEAAERIHESNLKQQLPRSWSGDELDRLTEVFNSMTVRLHDSFSRVREFTLHASHELKTPLTVLRGETETALREENLSEAQRKRLLSQLDEYDRLARIVDGLTFLTKADAGQIPLKSEPLRLDEFVREAIEDAQTIATPSGIRVSLLHCEEVITLSDRHRLRQLLLNLLDNAIKHNQPNGTVEAELHRQNDRAVLKIANTGLGVPPEKLSKVFERFYRASENNPGASDGCGLGLSIAQWIVFAHGGEIRMTSDATNTVVTVSLPAASNTKHSETPGERVGLQEIPQEAVAK